MDEHLPLPIVAYEYRHSNGAIIRKPLAVVEAAGGPFAYFDSPFVDDWWPVYDKEIADA